MIILAAYCFNWYNRVVLASICQNYRRMIHTCAVIFLFMTHLLMFQSIILFLKKHKSWSVLIRNCFPTNFSVNLN